jgi:hypothetical protein
MSGVFQNIDPPPHHRLPSMTPPPFGASGGHTRWVERGCGVNSSEDARHCSVLYICKYFVMQMLTAAMMALSAEVKEPSRTYGTILLGHCAPEVTGLTIPRVALPKSKK